ncbi:MAG: hypothetical protein GY855_17275, partial [candidate division Zixibacteria bacterium]|nr:hypothetical protein [candidate division Zixibacteria bacterium]
MRKLSLILMAIIVSITAYGIGYPQNVIWEKTYGGVNNDLGKSVRQTTDGGFIVVGATWVSDNYDIWLLKLDPNGNIVWEKTYGEGEKDIPYTIRQTDDNGFIILGITASFGTIGQDFLLIKTDSLGNTEWIQTYGGSGYDDGRNVEQTSDKGYILAGFSTSFDSSFDAMLVKTDSLGNMQWYKNYSFSDYLHPFGDYAQHAIQTSDG